MVSLKYRNGHSLITWKPYDTGCTQYFSFNFIQRTAHLHKSWRSVTLRLLPRDLTLKLSWQSRYRAYVLEPKVTHVLRTNIHFLETSWRCDYAATYAAQPAKKYAGKTYLLPPIRRIVLSRRELIRN